MQGGTLRLIAWLVVYFHFDVLTATSVNTTSLRLALGLVLAASGQSFSLVSAGRAPFFSKLKARRDRPCFKEFKPRPRKSIIEFLGTNLRFHSLHAANES